MEKELCPILRTAMSQRRFKRLVGVKLAVGDWTDIGGAWP